MKRLTILAPAIAGLTALGPWALPAAAQPVDIAHGRTLAQTWCVTCHVIDRTQTSQVPSGPPPFPVLADDPEKTPEELANFMRNPHPPMPQMSLTNVEVKDLVGYILSLKQ
jgi:cytochrome c